MENRRLRPYHKFDVRDMVVDVAVRVLVRKHHEEAGLGEELHSEVSRIRPHLHARHRELLRVARDALLLVLARGEDDAILDAVRPDRDEVLALRADRTIQLNPLRPVEVVGAKVRFESISVYGS